MDKQSFYVYILQSKLDHKLYIGFTTDLKQRLKQHSEGYIASTRKRRPFTLLHYEYFTNKPDAQAREKFLKSGYGHEQLKSFLKHTLA